jgi:membrane protease YdiL (CAAX protease family)
MTQSQISPSDASHQRSGFSRFFVCRYFSLLFPGFSAVDQVLATSVVFGVAHIYKGWRGVAASGISGVIIAALFVTTGSLVLPIVAHAAGNLRASVIFWPVRIVHDPADTLSPPV